MAEFTPKIQEWTLATEGGYVDHPRDPGGATNMGITHKTLAAWRGVKSVTKQDVRNLTVAEAMAIYKSNYWDTIKSDSLPAGLDYALFDYGVNSGPARAVKDLQRVLGVGVDGIVGSETLDAVRRRNDIVGLIDALCERRWLFVKGLSTFDAFGKGWRRRIWGETMGLQPNSDTGVADRAARLAMGDDTAPVPTQPVEGKAEPEKPSAVDVLVKDSGGISGIAGAGAAIFGAIADQPILQLAAVAFIGILVWRFIVARREADPA